MPCTPGNPTTKVVARRQSGLRCAAFAAALTFAICGGLLPIANAEQSNVEQMSVPSGTDNSGHSLRRPDAQLAQAGSAGGEVGLKDKSISGAPAVQAPPPTPKAKQQQAHTKVQPEQATNGKSCRSIVGTWSSWASGMFGANDTRFNADGTITHPSSKGTWSCENGLYTHVWEAFGRRGPYKLSADGKQLIKIQDGSVSFFRGGAAPSAPARN